MTELTSRGASLWLQPDCSSEMYEIKCSMPDDFTISEGEKTTVYCINSLGQYEATTKTLAPPEDVELTIQTTFDKSSNWFDTLIEEGKCDYVVYLAIHCPKRGVFGGWSIVYRMENVEYQSYGVTGLGGDFRADNVLGKTYTLKASPSDVNQIRPYEVVNIPNTAYAYDLNAVAFTYPENNCGAGCDDNINACEYMFAAGEDDTSDLKGVTLATRCGSAKLYGTGGFGAIGDSIAAVISTIQTGSPRQVLAVNMAAPAGVDIWYTDDGDTYTQVVLATAATATGPNALVEGPNNTLFLTTSTGEIYRSEDAAVTWELVDDGTVHANSALNAISFYDEVEGLAGGAGGVIMFTKNGGESWTQSAQTTITDNIVSLEWSDNAWLALTGSDGLYYTLVEQEDVINPVSVPGIAGNTGVDMIADGCTVWVTYDKAGVGQVVYSINGGRTWETPDVITNTGWNAMALVQGNIYLVGNGGTIAKTTNVLR